MQKLISKKFVRPPEHYPPVSIDQVDFDYDEQHPWMRFNRQNSAYIKQLITLDAMVWLFAVAVSSTEGYLAALGCSIAFVWLLLREKHDDENEGHLRPNSMGDYWRARRMYIHSNKNEPSEYDQQ